MSNTEPIKYLSIVNNVIDLYQNELFKFIKKITIQSDVLPSDMFLFKTKLENEIKTLKQIQDQKSILENKTSDACQAMVDYLGMMTRVKNTSHSQRYGARTSLQTQDRKRFNLTGGLTKQSPLPEAEPINQSVQMNEIIRSFKIQSQLVPRMRMKWKSFRAEPLKSKQESARQIIGDNNIDLLSYTIPQIEQSIKRLSLQSHHAKHRSPDKAYQNYRTLNTQNALRKKYVPRLI